MSKLRRIIRQGFPALLLGCSIGAALAYADSPAPVTNGPQLVGTPVTSSGLTNRLTLPTVNVNAGEALLTCTKAPGTASVPVTDNHRNVWKEIASVASGSNNNIHVSMAMAPSTGLTSVSVNEGNCPQCYAASILMKLTNVHAITTATGNPYSTPASSAMQVTNGPVTLTSAKNRLMLACSEIEWAPNTNLSFAAWPYANDGSGSGNDPGLVATTFVQSPNSKYTGVTLNAAVQAVTTTGTFEIDLPFSPTGNQAGGLVVLE